MNRTKRGLGLLGIAAVAWLVAFAVSSSHTNNAALSLLGGLAVVVLVVAFFGGFVLLIWGLATRGNGRRASDPQD
jgi:protein-S-isoprenylcysteine O-methyltransferase Ste14